MINRGVEQSSDCEYIVFKYIEGQTLSDITYEQSLSMHEAFRLVKKVTNIIVEMHQKGVVHGDIHGENVMMNKLRKVTLIDLWSKEKSMFDDVVDICKLYHEVTYDKKNIPLGIKDLFPKKRDAVLRRYRNVNELQTKIIELTR